MMRIRIKGESLIAISMYLLVFYLCLPFAMVVLNSMLIRMIVIISAALFMGGMILVHKWNQLVSFFIIFVFLFLFWRITWSVQLNNITYLYYCFASLCFIFSGMILNKSVNIDLIKQLLIYISFIYLVTAITSIIGLSKYPLAAREMARGDTYDTSLDFTTYKNMYRKLNIVSWSQVYGMLFAIPSIMMIWKRKNKSIFLICVAFIILMIVLSQITYAVLMAIMFFVATYITRGKTIKTILITLLAGVVACLILLNLEAVLNLAVNLSDRAGFDFLTTKIDDLKTLLIYKSAVGDAGSRAELYQRSIDTFLGSPIVGLLFGNKASLQTIGYHSDFFDMLGTFGLLGLIILSISSMAYLRFISKTEKSTRKDLYLIFIGFIVLYIINPVFNSPQIFVGAFLYPLLISRYCYLSDSKRESINQIVYGV